jgi:hypothetical protein
VQGDVNTRRSWQVAMVMLPLFVLTHLALFLIMATSMISPVNTGVILSWRLLGLESAVRTSRPSRSREDTKPRHMGNSIQA